MRPETIDCVILANGTFPRSEIALKILHESPFLIACDGAVNKLLEKGIEPDAIVGDLDSISPEKKRRYETIIHHNPDQETNDLTKSANFAREKGFSNVVILGATGKREDHTLANISLLTSYQELFEKVMMVTDYGTFYPIQRTTTFHSCAGQQVSVFALFPFGTISSEGLRYPIIERRLPIWWEGTLNEALGDTFTLLLEGTGSVLVYLRHK